MTEPTPTAATIAQAVAALDTLLSEAGLRWRPLVLARREAAQDGRAVTAADVQALLDEARSPSGPGGPEVRGRRKRARTAPPSNG